MKMTMCDSNGNGALSKLSHVPRVTGSNATDWMGEYFNYYFDTFFVLTRQWRHSLLIVSVFALSHF